jgi:hypothetical protein
MMQAKTAITVSILTLSLLSFGCSSDPEPSPGGTGGSSSGTGGAKGGSGGSGSGGSGSGGVSGGGSGGASQGGSGGSASGGAGGDSVDMASSDTTTGSETGSETGGVTDTAGGGDLAPGVSPMASFFLTSRVGAADFGGLEGGDKICQDLAAAVGLGGKTWKAYLSNDTPKVDAKSRIGNGPWYNIKGTKIADDVAGLHTTTGAKGDTPGNMASGTNSLTEKGATVSAHDIITGSNVDGTLAVGKTCMNWTGMGTSMVGHHNRMGGGVTSNSWNSAHENQGCTATSIKPGGGEGRFYCFATTP